MVDPGPLTTRPTYKSTGRTSGTPTQATGAPAAARRDSDSQRNAIAPTPPKSGTPVKQQMSGAVVPTDSQRAVAEAGIVPMPAACR